ncbi:MAG: DUF3592 domain-containing protein [Verrucomicrobiota bacterium]
MSSVSPKGTRPQCKASNNPLASRLWIATLGLSLCLMGLAGGTYLWLSFQKARKTDQWVEQGATVIVSMIDNSARTQHNDVKYLLEVHYRYHFEGEKYLSSRVKILPVASRDKKKIRKWQQRYPVGKQVTCYIDPKNPSRAVLIKPTKAAIYSIWFPSLLIVFGLKMIWGIFSTKAEEQR